MKLLSSRTMAEDADKHKNNANEVLSTRTMPNEVAKHKNNANEATKQENDVAKHMYIDK